jgi:two-component system response regulator AtoC
VLEGIEKKMIAKALEDHVGNQTRAAEALGIGQRMLRYKIGKLGLRKTDREPRSE